MAVFVLDSKGRALMPCTEKRATKLLSAGRARVHRLVPFVIRVVDRQLETCGFQPMECKLDPGSKTSGLAVVRVSENTCSQTSELQKTVHVLSLFELIHRGREISKALTARRAMRRGRRGRNTRYREARFLNRGNKKRGWLAPSLQHRVNTTCAWVNRIQRWAPITQIAQELVRFDMQKMQAQADGNDIAGSEYQQGALFGYEVKEYLLEKFNRTCAYCDAKDTPLQVEHIQSKARGGSNRVSNLTLACRPCNQKKAALPVSVFLAKDPLRLKHIESKAKAPLKDAAAVNTTRWALFTALKATGLPVEVGSGGKTKWNRTRLGIPKTHALDALCVGSVNEVSGWNVPTLAIKCTGRGAYQRTRLNKHGGIRGYLTRKKQHFGFQTGDMVSAKVPTGKKAGLHVGRVAVRSSGSFNIQTSDGLVQGVSHRHCKVLQRGDGYGYSLVAKKDATSTPPKHRNAAHSTLYLPGLKAGVSRAF